MSDWHERIPKVELHVHLEGSIPLPTLWELIAKYGGDSSTPDLEALRRRFVYRDFAHFIETWTWQLAFLREYEDFTRIAEAVARDFARQNIRYVEAYYSPGGFRQHGLETLPLTHAIRAGLDRVPEVEVKLVTDLVRNYGPERGASTLSELRDAHRRRSRTCMKRRGGWASARAHTQARPPGRTASGEPRETYASTG